MVFHTRRPREMASVRSTRTTPHVLADMSAPNLHVTVIGNRRLKLSLEKWGVGKMVTRGGVEPPTYGL